jgi:hypothetical protein
MSQWFWLSRLNQTDAWREGRTVDASKGRTVDVSDSSAARHLKSVTRHVLKKVDSPLIREPPKQPPAKLVLSWRSRRLAAQRLSRVLASKQGEVLIMQRMGYTNGPSAPFASELEAFDKMFDGNLTTSNVEALDALFPDGGKGLSRQPRRRKGHLLGRTAALVLVVFHLCNIETRGLLLGWSSYGCFRSTSFGAR